MINKRNRGFLQRFWTIAKLYWCGNEKWGAIALLLTLIALVLVSTQVKVLANTQQGNILSTLVAKDVNGFWTTTWKLFGLSLMLPTIWCAYHYTRKKLVLYWRRWLTHHFLGKYSRNRAFYELSQFQQKIDNPDQRIAEDINKFADGFLLFFFDMFNAGSQIIAFSAVLWIISPTLMVVLVIYAVSGTLLTIWLFGTKLVRLNFEQLKKEANFRFGLVRLRENAESVAFYRGEAQEFNQVKHLFNQVFKNYNNILFWQDLIVNIGGSFYYYIPSFLPALIIAPQIFSGELEIGKLAEAQGAFNTLSWEIHVIIRTFKELAGFAAGIERLSEFYNFLQQPKKGIISSSIQHTIINTVEDSCLALQDLTLYTPNYQRTLFQDVSVKLQSGQGMLIMGASGCGKSSLLRAIAGLWNSGNGTIIRPKLEEILFLPQRPYMVLGNLRQQLVYPLVNDTISDRELHQVLQEVNLPNLVERSGGFDIEKDWGDVLSLGEQQRVAFARLLISKPKYVILDEATSALDVKNEENLYRHLLGTQTTFISVGHRPTLFKYHHLILELLDTDKWEIREYKVV
ncbi:ABC transporter ATP-binding protein/permease [Phormidium sp. LEGE 05292]|uniref:ABC transporter ATP-binding protein/permease n=1 Tax=[Phormidium] sp. LEGE 05292 TaxID=767427 RepID=UPI00187EE223|nr:ABC transporter ATP-binding protein/permease [Phormidium sp. LEGE 05292]MBE9226696.1 ABC transporter ATP-binding protein/permease [Phormidium sp. LEGE 05292]